MKIKPIMYGLALTLIMAWGLACLAVSHPKVQENSRRINTDPIYVKNQNQSLVLSSQGHTALYHKNYALAEKKLREAIALEPLAGMLGHGPTWGAHSMNKAALKKPISPIVKPMTALHAVASPIFLTMWRT